MTNGMSGNRYYAFLSVNPTKHFTYLQVHTPQSGNYWNKINYTAVQMAGMEYNSVTRSQVMSHIIK